MSEKRIPSLDGIRGVAIALVIVGHLAGVAAAEIPSGWLLNRLGASGGLGVRVFFVLSGFLITTLLLKEFNRAGTIDLKRFYLRRTLRIFPAFYVFLLVLLLLKVKGLVELPGAELLYAATYTTNYLGHHWLTGHVWSLSVEEQFYLLWPAAVLLLTAARAQFAAIAVIILCPLLRMAYFLRPEWATSGYAFEVVADALAVGCLLACLHQRPEVFSLCRRWRNFSLTPVLSVVIACVLNYLIPGQFYWVSLAIGGTLLNFSIAIGLDWCIANPFSRVGRMLNAGGIKFIGVISYSLYIWQQLFLNPYAGGGLVWKLCFKPWLAFVCALLSYYLIERPALDFRQWLEARIYPAPVTR